LREVGSLSIYHYLPRGFSLAPSQRWFGWEWDFERFNEINVANSRGPGPTLRSGIISVARCLFTGFNFIHILLKGPRGRCVVVLNRTSLEVWYVFLEDEGNSAKKMRWKFPKTHHIIPKVKSNQSLIHFCLDVMISNQIALFQFPKTSLSSRLCLPRSKYQLSSSCG